ncbi:response regulator transcription factor [Streptomyces sp. ID05-04B]|uniref:DNA-binding response regulator n=1 Tax=unclassified Streptomyces TaxID=2593676 RepID=UPI00131EDD88|nr:MULTISPECIES: response regulator transcription factor [unclassified Streptomyces]MDX5566120.1 response regulator transcription factor [Streptomyces sp. ID05-04B]
MADQPITVVICENHHVVIRGVRDLCSRAEPPIHVISAGNQLTRVWTGEGAKADVVVFDLGLQQEDVHELFHLRKLVDQGRNVVVFSGEESAEVILECSQLGIKSYVTKAEGENHLIGAIQAAAKGHKYTAPRHAGLIVADSASTKPNLTAQEIRVLLAWCTGGMTKAMVARKLNLSLGSVNEYIQRARDRYDQVGRPARDKVAMTQRLIEDGEIHPGQIFSSTPRTRRKRAARDIKRYGDPL